jgi:hypothetical protein
MADALTKAQLEILRRLRDGAGLTDFPFIPNLLSELEFLRTFKLVKVSGQLGVALSDTGRAYLADAETHAARFQPPDEQTTWW